MISSINSRGRVLLIGALIGLHMGLTGCTTTVAHDDYHQHPTHGWYDYYYYPSLDIYLDISGGYYWYRDHDHWTRVKRLPAHLHPHDRERVFLRLDSDRPHSYHQQHRDRYQRAPQRRDDLHGQDQRRRYAPGVSPDQAQGRDADHRKAGHGSSPPLARPSVRRDEQTSRTGRREAAPRAAVPPARRPQQDNRPRQTADTGPGNVKGIGPALVRKGPARVPRGLDRARPTAQAGEHEGNKAASPQRRNSRSQRQRADSAEARAAAREKQPRRAKNDSESRRTQPRGNERKGAYSPSERSDEGGEPNGPLRPSARGNI